jgi:hypothetical protein
MSSDQRLDAFVVAKFDIGRPAPAQRRDEHPELVGATPDTCPVRLHLVAGLSLEPHRRWRCGRRHEPAHELLHPRLAAIVAARLDLAKQNDRRNPIRLCRLHPTDDVGFEPIELLGPLRRSSAHRCCSTLTQISPHRIARPPGNTRQLPNARTVLPQNLQLHPLLRRKHRPLHSGGTTLAGGSDSSCRLGQFPTADDIAVGLIATVVWMVFLVFGLGWLGASGFKWLADFF